MKTTRFKNVKMYLIFLLAISAIYSCSQNSEYKESLSMANAESSDISDVEAVTFSEKMISQPINENEQLKLIKKARVRYKVKNIESATANFRNLTFSKGGYIAELSYEQTLYKRENRFTLKIPQNEFEKIMDTIPEFAEFVEYEHITTDDVSEEFIDLNSRLKTKLEVKDRYEQILKKSASTVEDLLLTEDKIRILQEEIESASGRLNYLNNRISMSTITVEIFEEVKYKEEPITYSKSYLAKIQNALLFGWELIQTLFLGILYIWPILAGGAIVLFVRKVRLRKK